MYKVMQAMLFGVVLTGCTSVAYKEKFDRIEPKGASVNAPFDAMIANAQPGEPYIGTVYFPYDEAVLSEQEKLQIRLMAKTINRLQGPVIVAGHASYENTDEYNTRLGFERSLAVAQYLRDAGVWEDRLYVKSFGKSRPAVDNHDPAARADNRRVEVRMLAQGGRISGKEAEKLQQALLVEEQQQQASPMMDLMSLMGGGGGGL